MYTAARTAGQIPQQPRIGRTKDRVTAFGRCTHPVDILQDPLQLAAGEVRRRRQACLTADHFAAAVTLQCRGDAVGAGVLPDDRVVIRSAGALIPYQRRLSLIRNT